MATFRVPYPEEPERRRALFERAVAKVGRHGTWQGTPEAGTFHGSTPLGGFAGSYRQVDGTGEVEFHITKKPFLVPLSVIEHEARKFVSTADPGAASSS
jgi:hypothetical protein